MLNYVELIGKCIKVFSDHIELLMKSEDIFSIYLLEDIDINTIEVGSYTRAVGRFAFIDEIPFPLIVADKISQLKRETKFTN